MIKKLLAGLLAVGLLAFTIIPFTQVSATVATDYAVVDGVRYSPDTETLRPNAAGDECNIDGETGATCPNHYLNVDEVVADEETTRIYTASVPFLRDLYNIEDHSVGSGTINHITVYARCKRSATLPRIKIVIKSNITVDEDIEIQPDGVYTNYSKQWALNPDDGAAWEWADIDALQIGIALKGGGSGGWAFCTQVYVVVDYTPVAPTITTVACSGFGRDWAIVNGIVTDDGGGTVTTVGFDYGLTDAYGSSETKAVDDLVTGDEFWMKLTGLTPGTVYHYRAKAFNGLWGTGGDRVFSTEGSPTLYEYLNTGGDAVGDDIYAGNWAYMQFTVGTVAHSLDFANIYVIRTGAAPGDAVLSIRHADVANKPTGADLDIMTLNANNFSDALDWVKFDFPDDITLEAGESYALVLRCPNGTVTNYLEWRWVAAGDEPNGIAGKSADSGITWTAEGTADYLFENWGEPVFEVVGAKVFTGYRETGDWLVVFTYRNYFTPYYMTSICRDNFYVRLLDDTTMIAQIGCPAWGYRPGSFYFSKALADAMEWGVTDFKVRLYGDFGTNPYTDYNIAVADWGGAVDPFLDNWVIQEATIIGDDLGIALIETIADKGEVLNAIGHIWFSIGIPYLNEIRPELFEQVSQKPPYEEEEYTHALQEETVWTTRVGAQIAATLTSAGGLIGIDGDEFGGILFFIAFILVVSLLTLGGHLVIGLGVGYPILLAGAWFGLFSWVIVGVITFLAVAIFIYKVWLVR